MNRLATPTPRPGGLRRAAAMIALLTGPLCASRAVAQTEPDTFRLRELIVTATGVPLELAAVPAAVTVLHGAELRVRGISLVADALRDVAGVTVVRAGSIGGHTSAFVRGGESGYLQVLIDGVQVNDPGGAINLAHLTTADIERVEVVRGPVSVLYGSDAVTGVVQIFTRSGGERTHVSTALTAGSGARVGADADGSYHVTDASIALTGGGHARGAAARYGLTLTRLTSAGAYAFNNEYDNQSLTARLGLSSDRSDAQLIARYLDREFHYPTTGSGMVADSNKFSAGQTRSLGLDAGHRLHANLELRAQAALHRSADGEDNPPDFAGDGSAVANAIVQRRSLDVRMNARLPFASLLTLGAEREGQEGRSTFHSESEFGPFDSATDDARDNTGYYAQLLLEPLAHTTVTAGARIDDNTQFGTFTTYRLAAARAWRTVRLHTALGTGFKEPTFYQNFAAGFVRGDPELQPEESRSAELGVLWTAARVQLGATIFDQAFRNLIQYTASAPPAEPNYYNVGRAVARGLELQAQWLPRAGVAARANYTFVDTEVTDEGFGEDRLFQQGEPLLRRPRHEAAATLSVAAGARTSLALTARHIGAREDLDFTDPIEWQGRRVTLPSYRTVDLHVSHALGRGARSLELLLHAENLLDHRYETIYNFPAAGRLLRLGVRAGVDL